MTRSEWVRAALLGEVHRAGQTQLPPQTAGAKSGAGGIVRGQVVPAEDRSPGPEPAPCRHPRFRRIGGVCSRCGERVKK